MANDFTTDLSPYHYLVAVRNPQGQTHAYVSSPHLSLDQLVRCDTCRRALESSFRIFLANEEISVAGFEVGRLRCSA